MRRSNALLQTLQKSTKVLEATVERKLAEERAGWEGRVGKLEEEVRSLTAKLAGEQALHVENGAEEVEADDEEEAARVGEEASSIEGTLVQKRSPSSASAASQVGAAPASVAVAVTTEKVES